MIRYLAWTGSIFLRHHSGSEDYKKSRHKKSWNQIKQNSFPWNFIFGSFLKHFPSSKIEFWPFLKLQKLDFGQNFFREIDFFDFTSFFGLDFFKFSGPLCPKRAFPQILGRQLPTLPTRVRRPCSSSQIIQHGANVFLKFV